MPYNFAADSFHTKKLCKTFFKRSAILDENRPFCVFEPAFGGLGATYDDDLRLIGKCVVDFLVVLIELFSLGVTAEALRANIGSKLVISLQRGAVNPKFQVEGVTSTNHSSSQKIRLNALSYDIKIWTDLSSVLSQFTRLTDGRTDRQADRETNGQTAFSTLDRVCIPCSAVKMIQYRDYHVHQGK